MMVDLDYPNEAEILWLFDQDVSDTAILCRRRSERRM
jgi:hypothetical protein